MSDRSLITARHLSTRDGKSQVEKLVRDFLVSSKLRQIFDTYGRKLPGQLSAKHFYSPMELFSPGFGIVEIFSIHRFSPARNSSRISICNRNSPLLFLFPFILLFFHECAQTSGRVVSYYSFNYRTCCLVLVLSSLALRDERIARGTDGGSLSTVSGIGLSKRMEYICTRVSRSWLTLQLLRTLAVRIRCICMPKKFFTGSWNRLCSSFRLPGLAAKRKNRNVEKTNVFFPRLIQRTVGQKSDVNLPVDAD